MADYLGKKIKFNIEDNDLQKIRFNKAYGESQQATRSGKNLFDSSQIVNVRDYIVANGTGIKIIKTTNERISPLYNISLKANTEYTISCNLTSTTTHPTMYCQWKTNDGSTLWVPNLSNGSTTFTPSKDIVGVIFYLQTTDTDGTYVELTNLQIEKGSTATDYEPYGVMPSPDYRSKIENLEGKNKFNYLWFDTTKEVDWTAYQSISNAKAIPIFIGKGKAATFSSNVPLLSGDNLLYAINNLTNSTNASFALGKTQTVEANNEGYVYVGYIKSRTNYDKVKDGTYYVQVEEGTVATPYVPYHSLELKATNGLEETDENYQEQVATFPLLEGQKLMEGSYLADDGIHHNFKEGLANGTSTTFEDAKENGKFYCNQKASGNLEGKTIAFDTEVTDAIVQYELAEEEIVPYTETQQEAWEKLRHFKGLNGENNITAQGTMTSTLDLTLYNVAEEDFDIYISKKGYFGALKYDINNLIDFMESNIPSIAEATESSVKIAGRDGDISLNTVYEPLPFEIVCYTEDNLTPEEKIIEEQKITSLLNSIKNQTKTFFMEREKKFYKVKYSGNLSVVRYPKHLKFTIPLKSSESYAMNFEESEIIGNGTKVSNTIKDTGAIFTIKGPATKPIISLNNYQMKYNENILEGNSLIINSEDSTITHITSAGVKTNAMRAYNHEFPKIKNGENQLAISSGIDDEKQVNVKWYDLKI